MWCGDLTKASQRSHANQRLVEMTVIRAERSGHPPRSPGVWQPPCASRCGAAGFHNTQKDSQDMLMFCRTRMKVIYIFNFVLRIIVRRKESSYRGPGSSYPNSDTSLIIDHIKSNHHQGRKKKAPEQLTVPVTVWPYCKIIVRLYENALLSH